MTTYASLGLGKNEGIQGIQGSFQQSTFLSFPMMKHAPFRINVLSLSMAFHE